VSDVAYEAKIARGLETRKNCGVHECSLYRLDWSLVADACATCKANDPAPIRKPNLILRSQIRRPSPSEVPPWVRRLQQGGFLWKHPDCWIVSSLPDGTGRGATASAGSSPAINIEDLPGADTSTTAIGVRGKAPPSSTPPTVIREGVDELFSNIFDDILGGEQHRPVTVQVGAVRLTKGREEGKGNPPYFFRNQAIQPEGGGHHKPEGQPTDSELCIEGGSGEEGAKPPFYLTAERSYWMDPAEFRALQQKYTVWLM